MIYVEHYLTKPLDWYMQLNRFISSRVTEDQFILLEDAGEGGIRFLMLQEGLWVNEAIFKLKEELHLHRLSSPTNQLFIINFYFSQTTIKQEGDNQKFNLSFDEVNMLLNSSCSEFKMIFPVNEEVRTFNIGFTREWLEENVLGMGAEVLRELFNNDQPIYLSERLNPKFRVLFSDINLAPNKKLITTAHVLMILNDLFEQLSQRENEKSVHVHYTDMEQIIAIRSHINENIQELPRLDELAASAGMSLSKFKRLFKQIVGFSPYQYHLNCKLEKAMELIKKGEISISEIGYIVGYSNISQFSKAFKNHFGVLPSKA